MCGCYVAKKGFKLIGGLVVLSNIFFSASCAKDCLNLDHLYPISDYECILNKVMLFWANIKEIKTANSCENNRVNSFGYFVRLYKIYCKLYFLMAIKHDHGSDDLGYLIDLIEHIFENNNLENNNLVAINN